MANNNYPYIADSAITESLQTEEKELEYELAGHNDPMLLSEKVYALMLFYNEFEIGMSSNPYKWVNTKNLVYTNGTEALNAYANTRCPASQLVEGKNMKELMTEMIKMKNNFKNKDWLVKLYECI